MDDRRNQLANMLMNPDGMKRQQWMPQQQNNYWGFGMQRDANSPQMWGFGMPMSQQQSPMQQGFKPYYPSMEQPQQAMPPQGFAGQGRGDSGLNNKAPVGQYNFYQNT